MITNLPNELLLEILYHLDDLTPISSSSRIFDTFVRDYQASQFRSRLSRLPNAELLVSIWSPPTFFPSRHSRHRSHHNYHTTTPRVITSQSELLNLLGDPSSSLIPRLDSYLLSLERRSQIASRVASHLQRLLSFRVVAPHSHSAQNAFAEQVVIWLWSAQQRYSHDPDGYIGYLPAITFESFVVREPVLAGLEESVRRWVVEAYVVLSMKLKLPFAPYEQGRVGLWLWRMIVRGGMEDVLNMLERRA